MSSLCLCYKICECECESQYSFVRLSDINECTTNVHECDANAFCNNTEGSYLAHAALDILEVEHRAMVIIKDT